MFIKCKNNISNCSKEDKQMNPQTYIYCCSIPCILHLLLVLNNFDECKIPPSNTYIYFIIEYLMDDGTTTKFSLTDNKEFAEYYERFSKVPSDQIYSGINRRIEFRHNNVTGKTNAIKVCV